VNHEALVNEVASAKPRNARDPRRAAKAQFVPPASRAVALARVSGSRKPTGGRTAAPKTPNAAKSARQPAHSAG
jgi:hypothetical protein